MARTRAMNRFHRYLARRHRHDLRRNVPMLRPELVESEPLDVSGRLIRRALSRDERLDLMLVEEPAL